ncbi:DgyrCDS7990 [Dimorphilus gyrociliatus]|uniref:Large ribosomal subunit protein uL30m n=1 Tax=Dimorphilus gyrociliatus TaxID=2664684 RepID=A0A7I8VXS5_9ANNE|nr:DgyrCDS7990 [Dimorphilus gyrociliatus]
MMFRHRPRDRKPPAVTAWAKPLIEFKKERELSKENQEEPAKLHVVYRVKPLRHRPWWEKRIIEKFNLKEKCNKPVVVMNTPENNKLLKEVKHLLVIQPLKLPQGLPEDDNLLSQMTLKSNGELIYMPRPEAGNSLSEDSQKKRITGHFLKTYHRRLMDMKLVHKDYFPAVYDFPMKVDKVSELERKRQKEILSWWQ